MSQPMPSADNRVEMSANLRASLQRAGRYASEQSHRFVTIEHILLALNEDPDSELMLQACAIDQGRLHADISGYLGILEDRVGPNEAAQPVLDPEAARIVNSAVIAAQKSGRNEVNGAIVLAAVIGDGRTPAANMLRAQGLTFQAAIAALQTAQSAPQSDTQPLPHMQPANEPDRSPLPPLEPANQNPPSAPADNPPSPDMLERDQEPGDPEQRSSVTEDALATARRRIEAQRTADNQHRPESSGPDTMTPEPSAPIQQHSAPPEPVAQPADNSQKALVPNPPMPLQTEDSLARFERRPPPAARTPIAQEQREYTPPVADPPPVPPPTYQRPPEPARQPEPQPLTMPTAADAPHYAPQNFGTDPLRRPPPPDAMRPAPAPAPPVAERQPYPNQQPQQHRPPVQPQQSNQPQYRPPPPPADDYQRDYEAAASSTQNVDAMAGYQPPSNLPVPVPQEQPLVANVSAGQLIENIPRKMRTGVVELVEVRIARAELQNLAATMQGDGDINRRNLVVTKAMSVRLRAPEGGFFVETASPETQWTENHLGVLSDDYASWRWSVTPKHAGKSRLQLVVSARTIGSDGLTAETALPDQVFEVRVATNYGKLALNGIGWISAVVIGGLLAKFGEDIFSIGQMVIRSGLGG